MNSATQTETKIPAGMHAVTQKEFFAALAADKRDIMPSHQQPTYTIWETKSRQVWGWSYPGWKNSGEPKIWALATKSA